MGATVSLSKADSRTQTVSKALLMIRDDITLSLKGKKHIVIKPNLVVPNNPFAVTNVNTVKATIDFLRDLTSTTITVVEGSAQDTQSAFRNYGYSAITKEYGIELIDLNEDASTEVVIYDRHLNEKTIHIAKTMVDADYRVSLALPKTHDFLIVTLTLKNIVVGSAQKDKQTLHQGYPAMNLNMYQVAKHIPPNLAIIDGWKGMEGNGPVGGTPVQMGIALASTDFIAADTVGTYLMGFNPSEIGYLTYARGRLGEGHLSKIEVVGENITDQRRKFRPHRDYLKMKNWHIPSQTLNQLLV
jgi:uncharacterized protein (DUF362 family)